MGKTMLNSTLARQIARISPKLFYRLSYLHNRKRFPDLSNPKDISEIFIKQSLDGLPSKNFWLADKYRVREYVISHGYANLLTPLLGVYDSADQIDFAKLPNRFAIKMNFGAGMNIICSDKQTFDEQKAKSDLLRWQSVDKNAFSYSETHYNLIDRKIVIEEFIDDGRGGFPADFKFMCVNGRVFCVLACYGRETGHSTYAPFSLDWTYLKEYDRRKHDEAIDICRPANLDEMVKIAEDLSQGLGAVRVDLYSSGDKIWFGEITLTPAGCILHGWTQKALDDMGKLYWSTSQTK